MNQRSTIDKAVSLFFEAINNNDAAIAPLADDVVVNRQMVPEPIRGAAAVRQHIAEIAPFISRIDPKLVVIEDDNAAVIVEFEAVNGVVIESAEFFRVREGKIDLNQTFFDTRALVRTSA